MASPITSFDDTSQAVDLPALSQVTPSLPQASQSSSLLMQLPAELRLMVLRHLLAGNTPISSRESYGHPYMVHNRERERDTRGRFLKQTRKRTVSGYHFTPSVISTCQQLFAEALPILYHENTLHINIAAMVHWRSALYQGSPLNSDGSFDSYDIQAGVSIFDVELILNLPFGGVWSYNKNLATLAHRFRNFSVIVGSDADARGLAQVRHMLRVIAPVFLARNVRSAVIQGSHLSLPPPATLSAAHEIKVMKSFTLLRCDSFRFTEISGPIAATVHDIVVNGTPVVDLEEFMLRPAKMLQEAISAFEWDWNLGHKYWQISSRLVEAVENIDVDLFLQTRFEILQLWQSFVRNVEADKDKSSSGDGREDSDDHTKDSNGNDIPCDKDYTLLGIGLDQFHISASAELGFELREDGENINAKLRGLARGHNFAPFVDADTDADD